MDHQTRKQVADALLAAGVAVHSCSPRSVTDVAPALVDLAEAVGVTPTAAGLVTPVEPLNPEEPGYRDVLVVTFRRAPSI